MMIISECSPQIPVPVNETNKKEEGWSMKESNIMIVSLLPYPPLSSVRVVVEYFSDAFCKKTIERSNASVRCVFKIRIHNKITISRTLTYWFVVFTVYTTSPVVTKYSIRISKFWIAKTMKTWEIDPLYYMHYWLCKQESLKKIAICSKEIKELWDFKNNNNNNNKRIMKR